MNDMSPKGYEEALNSIAVPELEMDIRRGVLKAQEEASTGRMIWWKPSLITIAIASSLFLLLLISIRVSPVLASSLSNIPIMSELVELILGDGDEGLQDIVEHEYYVSIDKSATVDHLTVKLQGAIADETGILVYYQVSSSASLDGVSIHHIAVLQEGKEIEGSYGLSFFAQEGQKVADDQFRLEWDEAHIDGSGAFELNIQFNDRYAPGYKTEISVPFELEGSIAQSKSYMLNQEIVVSGQRLWLKELKMSPLRTEVKLEADPQNAMHLLQIREVKLIDENGEQRSSIRNGITARGTLKNGEYSIFLQSNYFHDPQQLTLALDGFEAVSKDDDAILVDFAARKVLHQPEYVDLDLKIGKDSISYTVTKDAALHKGSLVQAGIDAEGRAVNMSFGSQRGGDEDKVFQVQYELDDAENPVRLPIISYPNLLPDSVELAIPLRGRDQQ